MCTEQEYSEMAIQKNDDSATLLRDPHCGIPPRRERRIRMKDAFVRKTYIVFL